MVNLTFFKKQLFGISTNEASFRKRGFTSNSIQRQKHLETIGETFINGYNLALQSSRVTELESQLNKTSAELRGFAYEGAAMAFAILDRVSFSTNKRFDVFLNGPGNKYKYMLHVGAGWAMARLPWGVNNHLQSLDPLLRWLAIDGFGFHQGYFHWKNTIDQQVQPKIFKGYGLRAFDQGLGRSIWFVKGGNVENIKDCIENFTPNRHADLWSGIGLASAYAGGVQKNDLLYIRDQSKQYLTQLAQGAVFAAKARLLADNLVEHTTLACEIYLGITPQQAALIADQAQISLPFDQSDLPAYEIWRRRIQSNTQKTEKVA